MKRFSLHSNLILLSIVLCTNLCVAQKTFTMDQCIDYAMKHNPVLFSKALDTSINEIGMKRIGGEYLPTLNLSASLQYYLLKRYTIIEGTSIVAPEDIADNEAYPLELGYTNAWFPSLNAEELLYDPSRSARSDVTSVNLQLSKQQLVKLRIDLITGIYKSFATCLVLGVHESFLQENLKRTDTLVRFTHEKFEKGTAVKFEVNQMEVASNRIKNALIQVQGLYNESLEQLQVLMNYHETDSLTLTSDFTPQLLIARSRAFLDSILNGAPSNRIEYQMIQSQQQLSAANLSAAKSRAWPYLSLSGVLGWNPQASHFEDLFQSTRWKAYSYIGLNLYVPIFSGLDVKRNAEQAELQMKQADYDLASFENQYSGDKNNAFIQLKNSLDGMAVADSTLQLSEENVNMLKEALDYGLVTTLHVIVGENDLFLNQSQYFAQLLEVTLYNIDARNVLGDFNRFAGF